MHGRLAWLVVAAAIAAWSPLYAQRPRHTVHTSTSPADASTDSPLARSNNIFGAHLLVTDGKPGSNGYKHLQWARYLVGKWGYAKTMCDGITRDTRLPQPGWIDYVNSCYQFELVPVIRLAGVHKAGDWAAPTPDAPGDYHSMAAAVKAVVEKLPRSNRCPLYIEVWNEPNLNLEWSGRANPREYADFFVEVAAAIRSIKDQRIRILNGGLATNYKWLEQLCEANAQFISSFDVWASHPYPHNHPPSVNHHDKTAEPLAVQTIDSYLPELEILRRYGRDHVKVMITETGHDLGNSLFARKGFPIIDESNRADYMIRAFRDHWSKWPEIVAVIPFEFCNEHWERFDWVYPDSETTPEGQPTHVHPQYNVVAALAKSTEPTGVISGTIQIDKLGLPIEKARVVVDLERRGALTDALGNFILQRLVPGTHRVTFDKLGFDSLEQKVDVAAGANTVVNVALATRQTTSLAGVVCSGDDGKPLDRVKVELQPGKLVARTDSKGRYEFTSCVPARYTIKAQANQRTIYEGHVQVSATRQNQHNFVLGRRRTPEMENVIDNPGFEAGGGGAGKPGIGLGYEPFAPGEYREDLSLVSDKFAHTGRLAQEIRMRSRETVLRQITHYNSAKPGTTWLAGAWVRTDSPDENAAAWISLAATKNSGEIITAAIPRQRAQRRTDGWMWLQVELTAPAGTQRLSLNLHATGGAGLAYFDDLCLGMPKPN